jgi:hypothetical protein
MSLRICRVNPSILRGMGDERNRTLIFFVVRLRLGIAANTKRSTPNCIRSGYGRPQRPLTSAIADTENSSQFHNSDSAHRAYAGCRGDGGAGTTVATRGTAGQRRSLGNTSWNVQASHGGCSSHLRRLTSIFRGLCVVA